MKRYRRLIEPAAILLLVISAILPGWLSIAAGASALILLNALAASHFTGKKRLAVVVGLVAVLAVVFYINGQRNAKVQAGAAFEGMVEVTNRSEQVFEAVKFTSTGELGTGPEVVQKLETGQTIRICRTRRNLWNLWKLGKHYCPMRRLFRFLQRQSSM